MSATPSHTLPRVSVVIPAYNEEKTVGRLLDALAAQSVDPHEVIVVNAGSKDKTANEVRLRTRQFRALRLLEAPEAYPGRARNVGAHAAAADWISFIDCGTEVEHDWLEKICLEASKTGADVIFGAVVPATTSLFDECSAAAYLPASKGTDKLDISPSVAAFLIRREIFVSLGGFDEGLRSAEDRLFLRDLETKSIRTASCSEATAHWTLAPDWGSTFCRFRTYSLHNLQAGLVLEWQLRIWLYYLILGLLTLVLGAVSRQPLLVVLPVALFLGLRAGRSLWRHRDDLPASVSRQVTRFVLVSLILGVIDLATFIGTGDYLYRKHFSKTWSC